MSIRREAMKTVVALGEGLSERTRAFFEAKLGHDLGGSASGAQGFTVEIADPADAADASPGWMIREVVGGAASREILGTQVQVMIPPPARQPVLHGNEIDLIGLIGRV
jgi:hypothetical protein